MGDDKRTDDARGTERRTEAPATPDPTAAGSAPDPELEPDPRLKDPDQTDLDARPDPAPKS
jgi:hypothetical protein